MPYDISIFTTIASLSASFVAILGGFIASKLITVNGERERIAAEIKSDSFAYDVCCEIAKECSPSMIKPFAPPTGAWYERDSQRVYNLDFEIEALNIQKEQCQKQKNSLKKPRGMRCGITLFILFSVFNIIQPLIFSIITTINECQYITMKIVSISLLSIGLISTFIYLIWLLRWKDDEIK